MRELTPFDTISVNPDRDLGPQLMALARSTAFRKSEEYFKGYPPNSLLSDRLRAFLNLLTLALKPNYVLEIGTYMAGTAEVIARSLWAAGKGRLVTIDPYGAERVPVEIEKWPEPLQRIVEFFPQNSMQFFAETAKRRGYKFDIVFIDGNHDYEVVFHDLTMSAKYLNPAGVVVLDNAELPGVFWATKHFLSLNPGWEEITGTLGAYALDNPFGLTEAPLNTLKSPIEGVMTLVLLAPPCIQVADRPISFEYDLSRTPAADIWTRYRNFFARKQAVTSVDHVRGFVLRLSEQSGNGILHTKAYLRGFPAKYTIRGLEPEEIVNVQEDAINTPQEEATITFRHALKSIKYLDATTNRRCELLLSWRPLSSTDGVLKLAEQPRLITQ
ncbi:MAG: class I SAM-dependent methyltransferase [Acidobacteria bacterium]|nr:class I SAM-dependent methyltransferase [Acidobacteriota bacterium]